MTDHPVLGHLRWESYTHQSMWDMLVPADPSAVMRRAADLDGLAKDMGNDIEAVRSLLQKLLSSWTGPAADQTASALRPVLDWAAGAATTGTEIAARLGRYADAINTARAHLPAPVDATQLNAVADGKTVTVGPLSTNAPEVSEMAQGHTATTAQAQHAKNQAVQVMRHYEHASAATYHGLPTFHQPPRTPRVVSKPPTHEPPVHVTQPPPTTVPTVPPTTPGTTTPAVPGTPVHPGTAPVSTSLSSFVGPAGGSGVAGGPGGGLVGGGGVLGGAGAGALPGPAAVTGAGPMSGVDTMAAEAAMSRTAAAEAAEQGGWTGFGPMGQGGARSQQDGTHRDRYAGRPDIFGELPAAFPPVLGL